MDVSEMMTRELVTCSPQDTLSQAARKMESNNIGCCPVVEEGKIVGIITDRDITTRAVAKGYDPNSKHVGDIMTTEVISGTPWMSLEDAAQMMSHNQIRRLPIVDHKRLVGMVSLADLAIDLEEDEMLAETLQQISMPST